MPEAPPSGVREKVSGKSQVLETRRLLRLGSGDLGSDFSISEWFFEFSQISK